MIENRFLPQLDTLLKDAIRQEFAFPAAEYMARVRAVTREMDKRGLDVLITASNPTMCYLTGFQYTNTDYANFLLLRSDGRVGMIVAGTEVATVLVHGWVREVKEFASWNPVEALPLIFGYLRDWGTSEAHIGLDQRVEVFDPRAYVSLREAFPTALFSDASDIATIVRSVKSDAELAHLRKAACYTDIGMLAAIDALRPGRGENEIAAAASGAMILAGSEYFSTAPMVSTGRRTGISRAMFARNRIAPADPVTIELAGVFQRYSAPLCRTIAAGKASPRLAGLVESARQCFGTLIAAVAPGRPIGDAARSARAKLAPLDGQIAPISSFGNSIGVDLAPSWNESWLQIEEGNSQPFEEGMTFYSPIRLLVPGEFGACFGESWIVTKDGAERLSKLPALETIHR